MLLEEEMRRSVQFCRTMATKWKMRKGLQRPVPMHVMEGMRAYATEQADSEELRANVWAAAWTDVRARAKLVLQKVLVEDAEEDLNLPDLVIPEIDVLEIDDV
jgi:hypothetical protein